MARILGLDLGSYRLKGVVLETTLRGFTVHEAFTAPVPGEGDRMERLKAALPRLMEGRALSVDTVVVALPGVSLATHPITLPFSDPKKIEATLGGEVESLLPFDLSEAVYDYQPGNTDERGTGILVGVVKRDELAQTLELLKAAKLDPRIVTHPGLVYQNLFQGVRAPTVAGDEALAIIDLGHERTSIAIGSPQHGVELARTFPGGGLALSKALAAEFKIPLEEATAWKEQHGAVGTEVVGPDAERAAGAFIRALQPVLRELRPTLKSWSSRSRRQVSRVILCGGTAQLRGLPEQLEKDLGIPTSVLILPEEVRGAATGSAHPVVAQAVALALRGEANGARAPRFNLRRGEFSFKSDFDFMREKLGQIGAFALVLFVLLVAGGIVRNSVLQRRDKQLDAMLCDVTQRVLGKCEPDYEKALSMLRGQESPAAGIPKRSAATLLAELTQRVPTEMDVTMDQLQIDLDRISMRCETSTSKQMEDLIAALKTYKCFQEVKEGKVEKNKDGTKVVFRLDIQVECPEDNRAPQG